MYATPEFWLGWIIAYTQWALNKPFMDIMMAYSPTKLILDYFPLHEMDPNATEEIFKKHLTQDIKLKELRKNRNLSQSELADISGVALRLIKAYEQKKLDITKAQGITLYKLSNALDCKIEDLLF